MMVVEEKKRLVLRSLLRHVLRFCLKNSLRINEVMDEAKNALVELATEELSQSGERLSVSRISVMTGITRREVTKIYREKTPVSTASSLITRLIGQWEQNPEFSTKSKGPRVLGCRGKKSSFKALVDSVSKDVNYKSVLFELERLGFVRRTGDEIELLKVVHLHDDPTKGLELLYSNAEHLLRSGEENLFNPHEYKNLHLRTIYDNVFVRDIPNIRRWMLEEGARFHKRARDYISQFDKDISTNIDKEGGAKVVLCAFSLTELPDSKAE